jgi:hypothetical protein
MVSLFRASSGFEPCPNFMEDKTGAANPPLSPNRDRFSIIMRHRKRADKAN